MQSDVELTIARIFAAADPTKSGSNRLLEGVFSGLPVSHRNHKSLKLQVFFLISVPSP